MAETVKIPGELESTATGNKVVDVANVKDKTQGNKTQFQINADVEEAIGADDVPGSIKGRIKENETALGEGGSVDQRIAEEGAKHYLKSETYTKSELNNMITTPNQEYVTVTATDQTTAATDVLPATGSADTVYRVGNWDGSQYDTTCYTEYAWNGSAYILLATKEYGVDDEPTAGSDNLVKSGGVKEAIDKKTAQISHETLSSDNEEKIEVKDSNGNTTATLTPEYSNFKNLKSNNKDVLTEDDVTGFATKQYVDDNLAEKQNVISEISEETLQSDNEELIQVKLKNGTIVLVIDKDGIHPSNMVFDHVKGEMTIDGNKYKLIKITD